MQSITALEKETEGSELVLPPFTQQEGTPEEVRLSSDAGLPASRPTGNNFCCV